MNLMLMISLILLGSISFIAGWLLGYSRATEKWAKWVVENVPEPKPQLATAEQLDSANLPKMDSENRVVNFKRSPAWQEPGRVVRSLPKVMRVMTKDDR